MTKLKEKLRERLADELNKLPPGGRGEWIESWFDPWDYILKYSTAFDDWDEDTLKAEIENVKKLHKKMLGRRKK
jgi:hypothetical protein